MNESLIATGGTFDIIHADHINLFQQLSRLKPMVGVFVNSDKSVSRYKGYPYPLMPAAQKKEIIEAIQFVTFVDIFDEDTPSEIIFKYKPAIWAKGGDWNTITMPETSVVESYGGEVIAIPMKYDFHVSDIIKRIREG